jgi:hypothetical protein
MRERFALIDSFEIRQLMQLLRRLCKPGRECSRSKAQHDFSAAFTSMWKR